MPTQTDRAAGDPAGDDVPVVDGVAHVVVGDGTRRNALDSAGWRRLTRIATRLTGRTDVRVVLFRGAGDTFCAGSDLREWDGVGADVVDQSFAAMEDALQAVERIDVPTVAAVQGVAAGAGCELALACDLRVLAASARIGMPILRLGILCSPGFALRMTSLVGAARSRELLYTGRLLTAEEAQAWGLTTDSVPADLLDERVRTLVACIAEQPRAGLVAAKAATDVGLQARRREHDAPGWQFSDPDELPRRVAGFLAAHRPG